MKHLRVVLWFEKYIKWFLEFVIFSEKLTSLPKIRYSIFTKIEHGIPNFDFNEHGIANHRITIDMRQILRQLFRKFAEGHSLFFVDMRQILRQLFRKFTQRHLISAKCSCSSVKNAITRTETSLCLLKNFSVCFMTASHICMMT